MLPQSRYRSSARGSLSCRLIGKLWPLPQLTQTGSEHLRLHRLNPVLYVIPGTISVAECHLQQTYSQ